MLVSKDKTTNEPGAFGRTYWMLNSIEMFERLAYFGVRAVVPLYIMQATEPGGLHLTAVHKGWIYMWWAILQSWLPLFTGGIADRYGYKKVLVGAISANIVGYVMMAFLHSYYGFFAGILVLATGTAFFKPALQGSIAQNLTAKTSSLGWGIFYWVVNIGAVMAPIVATAILGTPHSGEGWRNLFLASAVFTSMNLLLLFTFRDVPSGADKSLGLVKVFGTTVENIWPYWYRGGSWHKGRLTLGLSAAVAGLVAFIVAASPISWIGLAAFFIGIVVAVHLEGGEKTWQPRLPIFLLIMSCFWMMMYQLWDLHPNFIKDWVDSSDVANSLPGFVPDSWREYSDTGEVAVQQQMLLNINAALIIIMVVPISWLARNMRTLSAMLVGMSVATIGVVVAGMTQNAWFLLLGIVFFSLGEMWTGPKKNEYLGLIAPPGKKGLYLGYVNIPIGIGVGIGSMVAGIVYDNYGEKANLALKELAARPALIARAARSIDWSDSLDKLPELLAIERDQAFEIATVHLGDEPATKLLASFRHDRGQIDNLAYIRLATHQDYAAKVGKKLDVAAVEVAAVARQVDSLPKWTGVSRGDLWTRLRDKVGGGAEDSVIVADLWQRYGAEPAVLDNLALEYLAQGTPLLEEAVAKLDFASVGDIKSRIGIGRGKSFIALTAASGADDAAVAAALAEIAVAGDVDNARDYVYLSRIDHMRFFAMVARDWSKDLVMLEALLSTPEVARVVGEAPDWKAIAGDRTRLKAALAAKDWSAAPEHARYLLGLNPYEARIAVAIEVNHAAIAATDHLWDRYKPQYKVWIPFAIIGIFATIALGIFGHKAKKWADMNA